MRTRRVLALAVAILLASTVVGALAVQAMSQGRPGAPPLPTTESGALAHVDAADAQAAAWRPDAVLVGVHASEGPQVEGRVDPPFLWDTSGDAFVGNGAALAWTFTYASPELEGRSFWVTFGGDGSLLYARELRDPFWCCVEHVAYPEPHDATVSSSPSPEPYRPPLRAVAAEIDAPAAVAAVLDAPEFKEFALDHPVFMANLHLGPGPGNHSAWTIAYRTATVYGAFAAVDAVTGEVLHVGAWPYPCCAYPEPPVVTPPPPPEPCCRPEDRHRTFSGRVGAGESFDVGFPVESAAWLDAARVTAHFPDPAPQATYVLRIFDGHGRQVGEARGTDLLEVVLDDAPVGGTYTASVVRDDGASPLGLAHATSGTDVELTVDVAYATEPQPRPASFRFLGESWPGAQHVDLYVEGAEWTPMRPTTLALSYAPPAPGVVLELRVLDPYGNVVARARGDALATAPQTLVVDVPLADGSECCHHAEIVQEGAPLYRPVPWTLDVEVAPWAPPMHDDVGEAHAEHEG